MRTLSAIAVAVFVLAGSGCATDDDAPEAARVDEQPGLPESEAECTDDTGDLTTDDGEMIDDRPGLDLTEVRLESDGAELRVTFDVAGGYRTAARDADERARWYVHVGAGDPRVYEVGAALSDGDPTFSVEDLGTGDVQAVEGTADDDSITISVPAELLPQLRDGHPQWNAGTEGAGAVPSVYRDGCPGAGGAPAGPLRF